MRFGSVCSGIEAASVAWLPLGWQCAWVSEIAPFPCAALKHHYPNVPNLGDIAKYKEWPNNGDYSVDLVAGGTPCQSFSIAGLRRGLDDPRGNLMLIYLGILDKFRPRWCVWENVPGVLSSNKGRDFGAFLGGLEKIGYHAAWGVLDAQYFGLAQRRERVFVVGHLGDWRCAAQVCFDAESMSGNPAPGGAQGKEAAKAFGGNAENAGWPPIISHAVTSKWAKGTGGHSGGHSGAEHMNLVPVVYGIDQERNVMENKIGVLKGCHAGGSGEPACVAFNFDQSEKTRSMGERGDQAPTLRAANGVAVAFQSRASSSQSMNPSDRAPALDVGKAGGTAMFRGRMVRRLTPRECERLQGFPDDYTLVPYRGKPAKDSPRYKAIGNSWAVPCAAWLGRRIAEIEKAVTTG